MPDLAKIDAPRHGEFWRVDLGSPVGSEAGFQRPALVVSDDRFNAHGMVTVCPLIRTRRGYNTHLEIEAGTSGLKYTCYVQVEHVRTISDSRLLTKGSAADVVVMVKVERILRYLLAL